jgi:hypothetical protein
MTNRISKFLQPSSESGPDMSTGKSIEDVKWDLFMEKLKLHGIAAPNKADFVDVTRANKELFAAEQAEEKKSQALRDKREATEREITEIVEERIERLNRHPR